MRLDNQFGGEFHVWDKKAASKLNTAFRENPLRPQWKSLHGLLQDSAHCGEQGGS